MGWIILIVGLLVVSFCMESKAGKVILGCGVVAASLVFLSWLTGVSFLMTLAKLCVVIIVLIVVGLILLGIFSQ